MQLLLELAFWVSLRRTGLQLQLAALTFKHCR